MKILCRTIAVFFSTAVLVKAAEKEDKQQTHRRRRNFNSNHLALVGASQQKHYRDGVGQDWKLPQIWHNAAPTLQIDPMKLQSNEAGGFLKGSPQFSPPDVILSPDGKTLTTT